MSTRTQGVVLVLFSVLASVGCSSPTTSDAESIGALSTAGTPIVSGIGGKCLDDAADSTTNDTKIQLYACNGTGAQNWTYVNGTFVGPGGKCLDIKADAQVPGTGIDLYTCNGTNAQKWTVSGTTIKSTGGLCLAVDGGVNANGTPIELATCDGSEGQVWHVGASNSPPPPNSKSIREWVSCNAATDDSLGAATAFAAAKNHAFTLVVDCPVFIHIGSDPTRPIFIDNGTTVDFQGSGKFIVDNVLVPAFAIMSSSDIQLNDWNIEYTGIMPVTAPVGSGPGGRWNDVTATDWLSKNRGITGVHSIWQGYVNTSALFFISGASSDVTVEGLTATAYDVTDGNRFIPSVCALAANWKSNQTLSDQTQQTADNTAGPTGLIFDKITLDGTIMGWVGSAVYNSTFSNILSKHYGDLQDAEGNTVGGVGKWFAPPHLFYISNADTILPNNTNLTFTNIIDAPTPISATNNGDRVGVARDTDSAASGVAYSLKLACANCVVDGYQSNRPDGLMDSLQMQSTTIKNVTASYNSVFTHGLYPGVRFPKAYDGLTFSDVTITDVATTPLNIPIGSSLTQSDLLFSNVNLYLNEMPKSSVAWATNGFQVPTSLRVYHIANPAEVIKVGPNGEID